MGWWKKLKILVGVAEVVADVAVKDPTKRKIMEKVEGAVDQVVSDKAEQEKEADK